MDDDVRICPNCGGNGVLRDTGEDSRVPGFSSFDAVLEALPERVHPDARMAKPWSRHELLYAWARQADTIRQQSRVGYRQLAIAFFLGAAVMFAAALMGWGIP